MDHNIITLTDSYKLSHAPQYPDKTEFVYSYFEPRIGAKFKETVFFGLQYILKEYLEGQVVTEEKINEAEEMSTLHLGPGVFNRSGWEHILKEHDGRLPVTINAVKEGLPVPESNVLMTVVNTDPMCFWLTNALESLLVHVWYPSTVSSLSRAARKMLLGHLEKTGTPVNIDFMLHDFGFRGSAMSEAASIGGLAHLIHFMGTDNVPALKLGRDYYDCNMAGFSVPASEHSTMTAHGRENELETFRRYFEDIYPKGIVACVSDSWDVYEAARMWAGPLKEMLLKRDGKAVFRPDSGEPKEVVPGIIKILGDGFGLTFNDKQFLSLPTNKIGVIQGDGCNLDMMNEVLMVMDKDYGYSADNVIFGMGGALLQKIDRDTQRFAFKCSEITVNGQRRDVSKSPITDNRKKSKAGRLSLIRDSDGNFQTVKQLDNREEDLLKPVFRNGQIIKTVTFEGVRLAAGIVR